MSEPSEMSIEEFDKWIQQNDAILKNQAERSAQNYLARRTAIELANKKPSTPDAQRDPAKK